MAPPPLRSAFDSCDYPCTRSPARPVSPVNMIIPLSNCTQRGGEGQHGGMEEEGGMSESPSSPLGQYG